MYQACIRGLGQHAHIVLFSGRSVGKHFVPSIRLDSVVSLNILKTTGIGSGITKIFFHLDNNVDHLTVARK